MVRTFRVLGLLTTGLLTVNEAAFAQVVFNPANGHYYEFVATPPEIKWTEARAAAERRTLRATNGKLLRGYLATITSAEEDQFLYTHFGHIPNIWVGASDAAVENEWRWVTGPEGRADGGKGLLFWLGGVDGIPIGYAAWAPGEPNQFDDEVVGSEDYMDWNHDMAGWNDSPNQPYPSREGHQTSGYLVEYGDTVHHVRASCFPPPRGLRAWWPGDGDASDIAGGNHGTVQGGATFTSGMVQQGFSLDGIGAYVSIPDSSAWTLGAEDFTIDLWVKFNSVPGRAAFVGHDEGGGETNKWIFWYDPEGHRDPGGPALRFHVNSPSLGPLDPVVYPWEPNTGQWYHVAVTRRGSSYSLYMDGRRVITETDANAIPDAEAPLTIGQSEDNFFFAGQIDEVEIYDRALSPGEIRAIFQAGSAGKCRVLRACFPPPPGLTGWWAGDGHSLDIIGQNHGILGGGTAFAAGKVGQAFSFDGVDDFVDVPDSAALDAITTGITVDAWINPQLPEIGPAWIIARRDPLVSEGFSVLLSIDGEIAVNLRTTTSPSISGSVFVSEPGIVQFNGEWQHIAVTADTTTGKLVAYANGSPVPLRATFGPSTLSGQLQNVDRLFIGRRQSSDTVEGAVGSGHYKGLIDEVEIFKRALSPGEIRAIFQAGSAGKCKHRVPGADRKREAEGG